MNKNVRTRRQSKKLKRKLKEKEGNKKIEEELIMNSKNFRE